jgi:hypothetical protein
MVRYRVVGSDPLEWGITQEEFTKYVAKVRREVREAALLDVCKMQCWMCEESKELVPGKDFNHQLNGWLAECHAHDVRRMIAADQSKKG